MITKAEQLINRQSLNKLRLEMSNIGLKQHMSFEDYRWS